MRPFVAVLVVIAALAVISASSAKPPVLKGTVGPGFTISLKTAAGKPVKTLKAGNTHSSSPTRLRFTCFT